jgi:hypothetical protein
MRYRIPIFATQQYFWKIISLYNRSPLSKSLLVAKAYTHTQYGTTSNQRGIHQYPVPCESESSYTTWKTEFTILSRTCLKSEQDLEKAAPSATKAYGTFNFHDESKMGMQPAQAKRCPLGYVLRSLVRSLLLVGALTMGAFIVVSVFL